MTVVRITRCEDAKDLPLPAYQTTGASGMDLYANIHEDIVIRPGGRVVIPAGVVIALPEGFEGQIRSRSGLALRYGVVVGAGIGTIDSDYRGEVKVLLANYGESNFIVRRGDRVAQLVVSRYERVSWKECAFIDSSETERGQNGYGSTGVNIDSETTAGLKTIVAF